MNKIAALLVLLAATTLPSLAQPIGGCADRSDQFNFWIGEWNVTVAGKPAGTNSIQPILDGCVLMETWAGAGGSRGVSLNFYNPRTEKWQQFWVWRNGTTLELSGEFKDGKMVLSGTSVNRAGKKVENRITWVDNADGTVRQHWEQSPNGKQWNTFFDGLYEKK